jgi:sugar lactone lactonase YvrE
MPRVSPPLVLRLMALAVSTAAMATLTGCAGSVGSQLSSNALKVNLPGGMVHGGQQPIKNAQVYLLAVSTAGYGHAATNLLASDFPTTYVTTDVNGGFSFAGQGATCPTATSQIYYLVVGGSPGPNAASNDASVLMAALGPCSAITGSTYVVVNEVSTVAAVYALRPFITTTAHGVNTPGFYIGTSSTNTTGLANAVASIGNLIDRNTATPLTSIPATNPYLVTSPATAPVGTVPTAQINTIADMIAPCVNSANANGSPSPACSNLFSYTTVNGVAPTDTVGAVLNIATHPKTNVAGLFSLVVPSAPFQPTFTPGCPNTDTTCQTDGNPSRYYSAPPDLSLSVTFSGPTGFTLPGAAAVDATGNLWVTNCATCTNPSTQAAGNPGALDYLTEFGPTGNVIANVNNGGIHMPQGIAIDTSGNIWSTDPAVGGFADTVTIMAPTGNTYSTANDPELTTPAGIAIDQSGNAWVVSSGGNNLYDPSSDAGNLIEYDSSLVEQNGSPYQSIDTSIAYPVGVAIGQSGNIFVTSVGGMDPVYSITYPAAIGVLNAGGAPVTPYQPTGLDMPYGISIDNSGDLWVVNNANSSVSVLTSSGANVGGSPFLRTNSFYQIATTAIDGAGVAWIPNCAAGCANNGVQPDALMQFTNAGAVPSEGEGLTAVSAAGTPVTPIFTGAGTAAVDGSGSVWLTNTTGGTVTKFIGLAPPPPPPLAAASVAGFVAP